MSLFSSSPMLLLSFTLPPDCRSFSILFYSYFPLLCCPHPRRLSGSCGRSPRPASPFPRPLLQISPVRMNITAIRQVGLRHADRYCVGLRRAGSDLAGPCCSGGQHKPPPLLTPAPTVAPSALLAGIFHLHAQADGPVVDQFEFHVQLQHRLTILRTCLLDRRLTVEHITNPSVRVSPFHFRPPNEPAAVG